MKHALQYFGASIVFSFLVALVNNLRSVTHDLGAVLVVGLLSGLIGFALSIFLLHLKTKSLKSAVALSFIALALTPIVWLIMDAFLPIRWIYGHTYNVEIWIAIFMLYYSLAFLLLFLNKSLLRKKRKRKERIKELTGRN